MNTLLARLALSGAALSLLLAAGPARAWDSICYEYADATKKVADLQFTPGSRGCEGIEAARGRFRDPEHDVDEHRRVLRLAMTQAGLPDAVWETVRLPVVANSAGFMVFGKNGSTPTIEPKLPSGAFRGIYRSFAIDELAQLPDFSYSLWDWGRGNEDCPLSPLPNPFDDAQTCHQFSSHMGATNSNHFPPQSDTWFAYYHDLAITRAGECAATRKAIWNADPVAGQAGRDGRLAPFFRACEIEALTYEAVAQHFLQDSWSAGHMWQRWGTTNLDFVPDVMAQGSGSAENIWNNLDGRMRRLLVAEIVAVSAGTIHGSDPVLWEKVGVTMHDALCYPHQNVQGWDGNNLIHVIGDLHAHDLIGAPPAHGQISSFALPYAQAVLDPQTQRLEGCAKGAVAAVFAALSDDMTFGHPVLGAATAAAQPFDPNDCRAPEVTNLAMSEGIEPSDIQPAFGESQAVLIGDIPDSVESLARNDYGRLRSAANVLAKTNATGVQMARLHLTATYSYDDELCDVESGFCQTITYTASPALFTMVQVQPNRCYDAGADHTGCTVAAPPADPLAPFADPKMTGPIAAIDPLTPAGAQAVVFHGSRAPQMCNAVTSFHLQALATEVSIASDAELPAACDACAEWTAPFLRIGTDVNNYDTTAEPLCAYTAMDPASVPYVYEPAQGTTDLFALARRHCGCKGLVAGTDAGLQRLVTQPQADGSMKIVKTGPNLPIGAIPRDVAPASEQRLLVGTATGQIVGFRDDAEIDMDGNPMNGITRLTFSGVSDVQALAVVNAAGKELLLAVTVGTGELIAWDLTGNTQCDRFSVAQVAGQGAYDVLTSVDGTTVFVSLRKSSPLSGAVATVSLPALAQCNGTAAATLQWLVTPGAASGLGPMSLAPDGSKLAVGGRLASTCLDQIKAADGTTNVDTQVGCDRVFILDVATKTWLQFGSNLSMPTRPGRYPYGVAWLADSTRLAYSTFQGIDNLGNGDSGWPARFVAAPRIPVGGTLRLADTSAASYMGGGGVSPRYWTYNMPLNSYVSGPTVVVEGGANAGPAWVFVGTTLGRISAYAVKAHDATTDPMWEGANADPETALHMSTNGGWYGGCSHTCQLVGGVCPMVCLGNDNPPGFGFTELGSNIRVLAPY